MQPVVTRMSILMLGIIVLVVFLGGGVLLPLLWSGRRGEASGGRSGSGVLLALGILVGALLLAAVLAVFGLFAFKHEARSVQIAVAPPAQAVLPDAPPPRGPETTTLLEGTSTGPAAPDLRQLQLTLSRPEEAPETPGTFRLEIRNQTDRPWSPAALEAVGGSTAWRAEWVRKPAEEAQPGRGSLHPVRWEAEAFQQEIPAGTQATFQIQIPLGSAEGPGAGNTLRVGYQLGAEEAAPAVWSQPLTF